MSGIEDDECIGLEIMPVEKARAILEKFDFDRPVSKWKPNWILSLVRIIRIPHHQYLIGYISKNMIIARLLLAYNNCLLSPEIVIDMDFYQPILSYLIKHNTDSFTVYNVICAIVRTANVYNVESTFSKMKNYLHFIRSSLADEMAYTMAVKIAIFKLSNFGIPDSIDARVLNLILSEYAVSDPENVLHAISSGRMPVVEHFFKKDFIDRIKSSSGLKNHFLNKVKYNEFIDTNLKMYIDLATKFKYSELIIHFLENVKDAVGYNRTREFVEKHMVMKNDRKEIHPLYDCDRDLFTYFNKNYPKIIKPAVYIKYITPRTFNVVRDVCNFKKYTMFMLYNIYMNDADEFDKLSLVDLKITPTDFYAFVKNTDFFLNSIDEKYKKLYNKEIIIRWNILKVAMKTAVIHSKPRRIDLFTAVKKIESPGFRMNFFDVWFTSYADILSTEMDRAIEYVLTLVCKYEYLYHDMCWSRILTYINSKWFKQDNARNVLNDVFNFHGTFGVSIPGPVILALYSKFTVIESDDYRLIVPLYESVKHECPEQYKDIVKKITVPGVVSYMYTSSSCENHSCYMDLCDDIDDATDWMDFYMEDCVYADQVTPEYAESCDIPVNADSVFRGLRFRSKQCHHLETLLNGVFLNIVKSIRSKYDFPKRINKIILDRCLYKIDRISDPSDLHYFKFFHQICSMIDVASTISSILSDIFKHSIGDIQREILMDRIIYISHYYKYIFRNIFDHIRRSIVDHTILEFFDNRFDRLKQYINK